MDVIQQLVQLENDLRSGLKNLDEYADRVAAIRAAVGGEAVPPVAWMDPRSGRTIHANEYSGVVKIGPLGDPGKLVPCREVYTAPLYTSPPATVDVGALRNLIDEMQALADRNTALGMPVFSSAYVISKLAALIGKEA